MKPLFCALALFTIMVPALAQEAATAPVATDIGIMEERPDTPTRTDDGLAITPMEMPRDHTNAMLGIELWQFKVEPPKDVTPETILNYRLELRRPGQNPRELSLGGSGFAIYGTPRTIQFTFGLMPDEKERFATSEKWRVYKATEIWDAKSRVGGQSVLGACENPLKGSKITGSSGGSGSKARVSADGAASLMEFEIEDSGNYDTKLVLVLSAQTPTTEK